MKKSIDKPICFISTGGTISMKFDKASSGFVPGIKGEDLFEFLKMQNISITYEVFEYSNKPSPHITIEDMQNLADFIIKNRDKYYGYIITHGTDVLEETAFFLDITLPRSIKCVVTASMRSNSEIGVDGPRNILGSVKTLISKESDNYGVLVVLNDEIHDPLTVTKTYTSNVSTFNSPAFGILGIVDEDKVFFGRNKINNIMLDYKKFEKGIYLYKTYIGDDGDLLKYLLNKKDLKGIVIEGFGRGNVPPNIQDIIEEYLKNNKVVVVTSRCHIGRTLGVYAYKGGGKLLEDLGVILSKDIKSHKAYLLLGLLLGKNFDLNKIKNIFSLY
ncbi:MAG: asparaginase [Spirochaetes bacterium]|nr:asparaginase [Spirochaetota bacterium]